MVDVVRVTKAAAVAGLLVAATMTGGRERTAMAADVTDEQVVTAMRKGADFLLKQRKADATWEIEEWKQSWDQEKGGETALVVYALLHAGDSLQDDPVYNSKLLWRSKEMQPSVEWLQKNMVGATYVAGLEASALTLLPNIKGQKPEEGPQAALESVKYYLMAEMGGDGGYTYPGQRRTDAIPELWAAYYSKKDNASKQKLDGLMKQQSNNYFMGWTPVVQKLIADIRARGKANPRAVAAELKALEDYIQSLPQPDTHESRIAAAQKTLTDLENRKRTGNLKFPDPKDNKKNITITMEDLNERIEKAKDGVQKIVDEKKKDFRPIGDLSNGQYGALGAWALTDWGTELPDEYWKVTDRFWRMMQREDGGWPYSTNGAGNSTPSMTAAGLASLFISQEFVDTELRLTPKPDKNIDAGLAWIDKNFKPNDDMYYMYGVERVGLASGLKFFGKVNWYTEGAANVIRQQRPDGSIGQNRHGVASTTVSTAYAMLFLARGRNPVLFNKLQYNGPWNARPRDNAYVTRWMSKQVERPINWQIVNLQVKPEEWMDAPILLITGSVDPKFSAEDMEKLRTFVNAGGIIFSTADGGKQAFTTAMKKYATELVNNKYEMRQLPKDHELFDKDFFYKGSGTEIKNIPPLLGMSNGARELWIHSPTDIGADWQMRKFASPYSFELGRALYYYASGKASLRSKLQPLAVEVVKGGETRSLSLARVDYAGNADPEPGAWARMAKVAKASLQIDLKVEKVKFADLDVKKYPLAHLTGTGTMTFTDEDAAALKTYLNAGGILFADAAGGNVEFAESCKALIKKVYPDGELSLLPPDHPIYMGPANGAGGGTKINEIDARKYVAFKTQRRITTPSLQGVIVGNRTPIVFSPWDVCSGFLGTSTWGILGYSPKSAEAIGRNLLLYVSPPPATAAATSEPEKK
ncbi:MAG: DUF4159 domain-containing protein [Phycisphaerales bacterium]|nr:DUF4159 domain-containing protein [Phycisphaerales bacterium]